MAIDKKWAKANSGEKTNALGQVNPYYNKDYDISPEKSYNQLVNQTSKAALDYQKNIPSYQAQNQSILQDQARQDLVKAYVGADQSANQRGMFYGGKRAGLRADAETGIANNLAGNIRTSNQDILNDGQTMGNVALEGGMNLRNTQQGLNNQAYDQALSDRSRGTFLGNLGASAPKLIGGLLGKSGGIGSGNSTSTAGADNASALGSVMS